MKKLLGGIFARSPSVGHPRAAGTSPAGDAEVSAATSKRWGAFLLPSAAPPQPADQEMLRQVDAAMRGLAAHVKAAIAKMLDGQEPDEELDKLKQFVEQVGEKLRGQSCEPSLELLKSYFSCAIGVALCDQTAFPSLVVDFVGKMRAYAMKEELRSLMQEDAAKTQVCRDEGADPSSTPGDDSAAVTMPTTETATGLFAAVVPSLELLMNCVVAIASNGTLMETYREGPQRMRMRLVRNYVAEENAKQATLSEAKEVLTVTLSDEASNSTMQWKFFMSSLID
ncbi:uncharacterized protein IUM83_09783 [Phytophthora cinnamomi]|uniref:uncharacterized protein n=1 Tax=Phytophthora cinnamomi TaxID=4785 RepID=UPI003559E544|nr:hypothetical protein IUM83_09783 [Phytophthora cinnamomi]